MKTKNFLLALLALAVIALTNPACNDDTNNIVTEDDIVELLENALSDDAGGLYEQVDDASQFINSMLSGDCGFTLDSSYTRTSGLGSLVTYNYVYEWAGELFCNNLTPNRVDFTSTNTGTYTAPRSSSTDGTTYGVSVTGVEPAVTDFNFDGTYIRQGTQEVKITDEVSFTSNFTFNCPDLKVEKATRKIKGGTGNFTVSATTSGGDLFTFTGQITYSANDKATVTIGSNTYTIDL